MSTSCPECGSRNSARIVYGMPGPDMMEAVERGEVTLGGCCVVLDERGEPTMPDRRCRSCDATFDAPRRRHPPLV